MNDFLQNLRNQNAAKERRFNKPSKGNYEGNTPNSERRSGQDRRTQRPPHTSSPIRDESLLVLQASLEALVETQRDRVFLEDRRAEAEERKADALERLADGLERLLDNLATAPTAPHATESAEISEPKPREAEAPELLDTSEEDIRKSSRKYILKLIEKLRKENMTYEEVAAYLTDNNFPTFSGRGRWHAQTIHRLCQ